MDEWDQMELVARRCDEYLNALTRGDVAPGTEGSTLRDYQMRVMTLLGPAQIKMLVETWQAAHPRPAAQGRLKLFAFEGVESDWVAAHDLSEARDCLRRTYGIGDDDIDGSYPDITEVDPNEVEFYTDETDPETEENLTKTAAEKMAGKTKPFVVGSTYE